MKVPLLLLSLVQLTISVSAQDSLLNRKPVQESYPILKLVTIQKEYYGDSDYKLLSKGEERKGEGEFSGQRLRIFAAFPVYTKNKLVLSAGGTYTRSSFSYYSKETSDGLYNRGKTAKDDFDAMFSAGYRGVLWNKPVFYNANLVLGSSNFLILKN